MTGHELARYRADHLRLTQAELARGVGVTLRTVQRWEARADTLPSTVLLLLYGMLKLKETQAAVARLMPEEG